MSACTAFTKKVWQAFIANAGHDANSFGHMKVLSATPGKVLAQMEVQKHQVNRLATLHGGLTSSLVDAMGSLAVNSTGLYMSGVSTDIHVSFCRGAPLGETVNLKSEVVAQGRTLAFTRVEMTSAKTGKLLAFGSHTKAIGATLEHAENKKFTEDGEKEIPLKGHVQ